VLILEDCEKALMDRGSGNNPIITTILNMTDGFLAASIKPHFICTFNCPLSRIDRALLRKGRLSFRYEFGDLSLEKCKAINPLADSPMPLSELYNMEEVVCAQSSSSKIGF
jgi:polyferredoxin